MATCFTASKLAGPPSETHAHPAPSRLRSLAGPHCEPRRMSFSLYLKERNLILASNIGNQSRASRISGKRGPDYTFLSVLDSTTLPLMSLLSASPKGRRSQPQHKEHQTNATAEPTAGLRTHREFRFRPHSLPR